MHAAMARGEVRQDMLWVGESAGSQWVRSRLAARLVHGVSRPQEAPFVRVDCGRLHVVQAEGLLFGDAEPGAFERAEGGTLFLEEVEALQLALQEQMLQVLTGVSSACPGAPELLDVRVIAGTDQDLGKLASAGRFCPELFVRLALVPVRLPPLRKRRRDIPLLAVYFLRQIAGRLGRQPPALSREAQVELLTYGWPGNVWELKRVLERVVVRVGEGEITAEHVQRLLQGGVDEGDYHCLPLTWN